MPIPDKTLQVEQEPNFLYSGKLEVNLLPPIRGNLSAILADANKQKNWPRNWWPCPPYRGRSNWHDCEEVITFIGPWGENLFFRAYLLGWSFNAGNKDPSQPGMLLREIPHQHPEMPWLYAMEAEIVEHPGAWITNYYAQNLDGSVKQASIAFVDTSTGSDYQSCKVQVTYRRPRYEVRSDDEIYGNGLTEMSRFLERESALAVDALPLPATPAFSLKYVGGPADQQQIPQGSNRIYQNTAELTYIWHNVPDLPFVQMLLAGGRVNSVPFDPPQTLGSVPVGGIYLGKDSTGTPINGYPTGTVLCALQPKYERVDSPNGRVLWKLVAKYLLRLIPLNDDNSIASGIGTGSSSQKWATWNHFPVTSGNKVLYVLGTADGSPTGAPLYPSTDLNKIYTQPNPAILYQGPGVPGVIPPG